MKQRLIDANKYLEKVCTYKETGCGSCKLQTTCPKDAPEVDAIPVAFIKEQMCKYENLAYNSIEKIQQRYFDKEDALKSLINYWREKNGEKENG
jgi:hypothetical protein